MDKTCPKCGSAVRVVDGPFTRYECGSWSGDALHRTTECRWIEKQNGKRPCVECSGYTDNAPDHPASKCCKCHESNGKPNWAPAAKELRDQLSQRDARIAALEAQLQAERTRAEVAEEALRFYADPSNLAEFVDENYNPFKDTCYPDLNPRISNTAKAALEGR